MFSDCLDYPAGLSRAKRQKAHYEPTKCRQNPCPRDTSVPFENYNKGGPKKCYPKEHISLDPISAVSV